VTYGDNRLTTYRQRKEHPAKQHAKQEESTQTAPEMLPAPSGVYAILVAMCCCAKLQGRIKTQFTGAGYQPEQSPADAAGLGPAVRPRPPPMRPRPA
jgi:hypothetical protein